MIATRMLTKHSVMCVSLASLNVVFDRNKNATLYFYVS